MYLAIAWQQILLIVLIILVVLFVILYFVGSKLQEKQAMQAKSIENATITVSMLVLDKKKLHIKDSGLMKQVQESIPIYLKWRKFPIVKGRIIKANIAGGANVMSFICDPKIFKILPTKTEVKIQLTGIYISKLISAKGVDLSKLNKK